MLCRLVFVTEYDSNGIMNGFLAAAMCLVLLRYKVIPLFVRTW